MGLITTRGEQRFSDLCPEGERVKNLLSRIYNQPCMEYGFSLLTGVVLPTNPTRDTLRFDYPKDIDALYP